MAKILLAEDDENLGFMIQDNLQSEGFEVDWLKNGQSALASFETSSPDLCLIDIMMPKMDGFELAKSIRVKNDLIPILFLTAKSLEEDRLHGFEIGGDDYITKPFSMKELTYRIGVFLKRNQVVHKSEVKVYSFGATTLDTVNLILTTKEGTNALTQMEGQLLQLLLENQNQLVSREHILETIWGENDYFKGRSLDVFITRLRKHLKPDSSIEIRNHHGVGFSLITN
ncbi:MAG: response regulator transcription factor [Ekhidna sp.]